jgi:NAD+ synthase (glutamine-hydrolysing)
MRLAVAQVDPTPGEVAENVAHCMRFIDDAYAAEAELVVFPELALTGMSIEQFAWDVAVPAESDVLDPLRRRSRDISIAIGFLEHPGNGRIYNAVGYFEGGELRHVHRKIYLTTYGAIPREGMLLTAGGDVAAFQTSFGHVGITICEDAWHPSVPYLAVLGGAELLLCPSASPRGMTSAACSSEELWTIVNRATAVTLKSLVVFANRVGREGEMDFWGGSHVVAPDGEVLARLDHDHPGLLLAEYDLPEISRQRFLYPYLRDERPELTLRELQRLRQRCYMP